VIQSERPEPGLLFELARPRHALSLLGGGTGPFRIVKWEPGRRASLAANDDYWRGRPYVDAVEVGMGRPLRDQLIDLELGKADLIDISPGQVRRQPLRTWS